MPLCSFSLSLSLALLISKVHLCGHTWFTDFLIPPCPLGIVLVITTQIQAVLAPPSESLLEMMILSPPPNNELESAV